jgi:hypothetical protein
MRKLTPMTVLMALVAAAAFVAKVKYGFHVGN